MLSAFALGTASCGSGLDESASESGEIAFTDSPGPLAHPRLTAEHDSWRPGTTTLAVILDIEPGWHLYWRGRNDSGYYPEVSFKTAEGIEFSEPQWPAPRRLVSPGNVLDHVYDDRLVLLHSMTIPPDLDLQGPLRIDADLTWMACREVCIAESGSASLTLPKGADTSSASTESAPEPGPEAPLIAAVRSRLPVPLPPSAPVTVEWNGSEVDIRHDEALGLSFYPSLDCTPLADPVRDGSGEGDALRLVLSKTGDPVPKIRGILEVRFAASPPAFYRLDFAAPASE